jgi:hypothetical protein
LVISDFHATPDPSDDIKTLLRNRQLVVPFLKLDLPGTYSGYSWLHEVACVTFGSFDIKLWMAVYGRKKRRKEIIQSHGTLIMIGKSESKIWPFPVPALLPLGEYHSPKGKMQGPGAHFVDRSIYLSPTDAL